MPAGQAVGEAAQMAGVGQAAGSAPSQEELRSRYMREEAGPLMHSLSAFPGEPGIIGAMSWRATNTITRGGWAPGVASPHNVQKFTGMIREGIRQRAGSPLGNIMYANQDIFHGTGRAGYVGSYGAGTNSRAYTPFAASAAVNSVGRMLSGDAQMRGFAGASQKIARSRPGQYLASKGLVQEGGELVSRGFTSRVAAAARTANMSESAFASRAGNLQNFLRGASTESALSYQAPTSRVGTSQALLMSGQGSISGRMGGYMAGTVKGATGTQLPGGVGSFADDAARTAFYSARDDVARLGLQNSARWGVGTAAKQAATRGSFGAGAKVIGSRLGMGAARFAGPIGAALLAHDVTRLAVRATGAVARDTMEFATDLNESYHSGFNQGRMLSGDDFQDNRASLSNRQRAVQSIQNSRLNARSVLGSEAGQMSSHFS